MKKLSIASVLLLGAGMAVAQAGGSGGGAGGAGGSGAGAGAGTAGTGATGGVAGQSAGTPGSGSVGTGASAGINGLASRNSRNRCQRRFYGIPRQERREPLELQAQWGQLLTQAEQPAQLGRPLQEQPQLRKAQRHRAPVRLERAV